MCPCNPGSNNINISVPSSSLSLPGLGLPFSIPKPPFSDISIPEGIPEDIISLIDRIFALFPQGIKFTPNADALTKGIWDVLASLFNQLAPFLAFYKFIQALLNIILCIIDVLCALFNPWATVRALKRLFKKCLPDFLSLFPWVALVVMILALMLLLIEVVKYIVTIITSYINQIIENIKVLSRAFTVADSDAILAAVNKISYLICMIEQLFSIFLAISAILAIIKPLMEISGRGVCRGGHNGDSCCTEDFCPDFIRNSTDGGFNSNTGRLIYFRKVNPNAPSDSSFDWLRNFNVSLRSENWQFVDDNPGDTKFVDIIVPSPEYGFTYWPEGESSMYSTYTGPAFYSDEEKFQKLEFGDIADNSASFEKFTNNGWLAIRDDMHYMGNEQGKRFLTFASGWALYPPSAFPGLELPPPKLR